MTVLKRDNYEEELKKEPDLLKVAQAIVAYGDGDELIFGKEASALGNAAALINKWLTHSKRIDLGEDIETKLTKGNINSLVDLANNLEKCLKGDKLSADECKNAIGSLKSSAIKDLVVPVKVAVQVLKQLGFKVYTVDQHYLHGQQGNRFESVEDWANRVSTDSLNFNKPEYDELRQVLGVYVRVANLHPDKWENSYEVSGAKPFDDLTVVTHPIVPRRSSGKLAVTFERFAHDVDTKVQMLAMLLPIRWTEAGFGDMLGGGYVSDDSYAGEIDRMAASGSVFRTAEILNKYLDQYLQALENNGVKIDGKEKEALKQLGIDLERREKSLVQVVSLLEKVLALKKYYGHETIEKITDRDSLHKIVESNKKIFEKVNKTRGKLMGGIRILLKHL